MKKMLVPLLLLAVLLLGLPVLAEGEDAVSLELNTAKVPLYQADDPFLAGLTAGEDDLPVILLPVKQNVTLRVSVQPRTVKNKRVDFTAEDGEIVRVRDGRLTGLKPGETILTIASREDPSVTLQYRVAVFQPVTRIKLSAPDKSVAVGQTLQLTAACEPENAARKQVVWTSERESVATVDENGVVTGVKRGNARIIATAADGSKVRANFNVQVRQNAEEITLDKPEATVDIGRNVVLKATVLPKDTDNKKVVWSSSDEGIAKVNAQGRVTGVSAGDCEIICTAGSDDTVRAKAVVHVQQPVKKIVFGDAPVVYVNETAQLTWSVEPANASNPAVTLKSGNEKIVTVGADGTITGVKAGEAYVYAASTDGSNRSARLKVVVCQHLNSVHMKRQTAYIDVRESDSVSAIFEPAKYVDTQMFWSIADTTVATAEPDAKNPARVRITGVAEGETVLTGESRDGGLTTSMNVRIGNWSNSLKITDAYIDGKGRLNIEVKNMTAYLPVTGITLEIEAYSEGGSPVSVNSKDGSNIIEATYSKRLEPGRKTALDQWKVKDLDDSVGFQWMTVRITKFQIDNDWIKTIRKNRQPKFQYTPGK